MARKAQSKPEKTVESVKHTDTTEIAQEVVVTEEATEIHIPLSACGGALRAAREKQKLSVQDIASQLRLGVRQVEALEADRYDKLPEPSIVRGFIRNYAKLLKIDSSPILAAYSVLVPNTTPQSFAVKSNANASVIGENRANFSFKSFVGLLLTFALIVWFFYYYTQVIKPNVASDLSNINAPAIESEAPAASNTEFALPAAERQTDAVTSIELPAPETNTSNTAPLGVDGTPPTDATAVLSQPSATPPATVVLPADTLTTTTAVKPSITPAPATLPTPTEPSSNQVGPSEPKNTQLAIDASEETWINITDGTGKQIYSKVLTGGTSETISVSPPLSITVGNAQGTTISVNGKPLDLLAHTRDKVARIKVN
jgi:cytoskeleton protein RodZ